MSLDAFNKKYGFVFSSTSYSRYVGAVSYPYTPDEIDAIVNTFREM